MILQVGVKILIKNRDGKYLLLHRSIKKYPEVNGKWDIVGGRIEPGKTLIENLRREVKEETTLNLLGEPRLVFAQDILRGKIKHVVRLTYLGKAKGKVVINKKEHDEYKWFSLKELRRLDDLDMYLKKILTILDL